MHNQKFGGGRRTISSLQCAGGAFRKIDGNEHTLISGGGPLFDDEHRPVTVAHHALGCGAKKELLKPLLARFPEHDQIGALLGEASLNYSSVTKPKFKAEENEDEMKKKDEEYRQARKDLQTKIQWFLILGMPAAFGAFGVFRWQTRQSRRNLLKA